MDDDGKRQGGKRLAARNSEFQKWHRFHLGHVMVAHANILSPKKKTRKRNCHSSFIYYTNQDPNTKY